MIEAFSERISNYVYEHNERRHVSKEVMKYALISIMTNVVTVILSLIIGLIDGKFSETCLALAVIAILRYLAGGHHLKSPVMCILVSSAAVTLVPFVPLTLPFVFVFTVISGVVVWKYAPVDFKNHSTLSDKRLTLMKYIAVAMVFSNLIFQSEILALSWFIVTLTLVPYKRR
ncbi:accessory gene regulator ArgB-like protein [Cohnella herbarum]|uniref:Accessory gene regulator B family protein n=1 Tax=Cohnella herbarum TaxID=2728023 RepID=A0A7Z2VPN3_9BACL|nr:accessory gene regulator B family protein [Cohnella herbarum]QJD87168.1 accessory gene regulator B family protein [Cohnella herbarum]